MAKKFKYEYEGPYYFRGVRQPGNIKVYTEANTDDEAERNIIYKIKQVEKYPKTADIDIDRGKLKIVAFRVHNVFLVGKAQKEKEEDRSQN